MGFEVPPSPVRTTRLRWPVVALAAGVIILAAVAILTRPPMLSPAPTLAAAAPTLVAAAPTLAAAATPSGPVGDLLTPPPTAPPRTLPSQLDCRQLDALTCRGIAQAAIDVLPVDAPPAVTVTVYRSLLCRDDLDCPPARLAASGSPSGSVVIGFSDGGPDAWIDVMTHAADLEAWIIR